MWKKLTVDMNNLLVKKEDVEEKYRDLGGRGLIAQYMIDNVDPKCDPLGKDNQLLVCNTIFAGTNLTTAHRISVGGKSPLTGGIKESNSGGYLGYQLAGHGIKMIAVKNLPEKEGLWLLHINRKGEIELLDASEYKGLNNYEFVEKMFEKYGKDVATMSIGVGGERKYKSASIQISEFKGGHPSRAAARGGLGSLMGSKGIKGIIVEKAENRFKPDYADEEKFKELSIKFNKMVAKGAKNHPFHNIGTQSTIESTGENGILPVENFSGKLSKDYKKVGAKQFMENLASRGGSNKIACQPGCVVQCSNCYNDKYNNYLTSGFEYETIALFGPNCKIYDLDVIAKMDRICDDIGVDTIDIANGIAVCMDAGKIEWGDSEAALKLMKEMKDGTEFGKILGNGCEAVGKHLGAKRIPVVKHQALAAYDPRNTKGTGITYSTSPMGADHTAGLTMGRAFDDRGRAAQAYVSNKLQVAIAFYDSMMCLFTFSHAANNLPLLGELWAALYGGSSDFSRVAQLGVKTILTEKAFNKGAGMTLEDDKLPEFFYNEKSVATGSKFDIDDYELEVIFDF
jgi:aldehyde:ferredoxin oxidoreductase